MSGALKSVGKVFKKVAKVVKKVAVPALIVGAVVLTGGAALGALPALGTTLGGLGLSTTMTGVLTGAISGAGYGALAGGAVAAISGRNVWKGAMAGGVTGAVTGGVLGGVSPGTVGVKPAPGAPTAAAPTGGGGMLSQPGSALAQSQPGLGTGLGAGADVGATAVQAAAPGITATAPAAAAPAAGGGMLPGFLNTQAGAGLVSGVGQGLMALAEPDPYKQRAKLIERNYGADGGGGMLARVQLENKGQPDPKERFDPRYYGGQYRYDPSRGGVYFMPNEEG